MLGAFSRAVRKLLRVVILVFAALAPVAPPPPPPPPETIEPHDDSAGPAEDD